MIDPTAARTRVLLVDDHPLFRLGIATMLERQPDFEVVGQASSAAEALEIFDRVPTDLIVVDILLGSSTGIGLVRELVRRRATRVLGLSVLDEPVRIAELLRAGALGFANKTQAFDQILDALRATVAGTAYIAPAIRAEVERLAGGEKLPLEQLTRREYEVLSLLARGISNHAIGEQLAIRPRTAETHRQRIMKKLGTHSLAELVRLAARWGVNA
jgi:DNA-binding NarL/FixJ family response regulator